MKIQTKKILIAILFTILFISSARAELTKQIDAIINSQSQKKVQFSVKIVEADSGKAGYSHNAKMPLIPASNMKIITTAAALKYLGADYEYKTKVGLCDDTLVVTASGDPLLGDKDTDGKYNRLKNWIFDDISKSLRQKKQTDINDIIIDSSVFDDQRVHPSWPKDELNRWYACEISGLNYNGNCIEITTKNINGKVAVFVEPQTDFVKIINQIRPMQNGKGAVGAYRNSQPNKITLKGKCKKQQGPFAVAIERPSAFFGFLLAEYLAKEGIAIKGRLIEKPVENCNIKPLTEYRTPIADCLNRCNKDSLGLAAEALLKTTAANSNTDKKKGGWEKGSQVISQYLLNLGVKKEEFYIDDGSGLSRKNKLTTNAMTKVLLDVYKSRDWQLYKNSLAVAGVDGTIKKYFKEEKYKAKIFAKTGYIRGVKSLSGVCTTTKGDYIFSIITNNANGQTRKAINDIAKAIIDNNR